LQWQSKLEDARLEWQTQHEQELRRRESEAAEARVRALREQENQLRNETQQKNESAQAGAKQREQELLARLNAQADEHQKAEKQWAAELELMRGNIEALLVRTEKERDEARKSAAEGVRQVQDLEKKLTEASSLLTGWKSEKNLSGGRLSRESFQARNGLGVTNE
jgi:hypothetical protein